MQNRVVLVTGASAGIGAATARLLAETSRVALVARRAERLAAQVAAIEEAGGEALAISADLAVGEAWRTVVEQCVAHFGGLDAVVHNAGVFEIVPTADIDPGHVDRHLSLNLRAPMLLTQAALPHLRERGGGWIVVVSSVAAAEERFPGCGVYAATKAGLEAWARSAREEFRGDGIRVGIVVPGATDTDIFAGTDFDRSRMARAVDVATAIRFMLGSAPTASIDRLVVTPPGGAL